MESKEDGEVRIWVSVVVTIAVLLAVVIPGAVIWVGREREAAYEYFSQITDARVAIVEARARIEALPIESQLRAKLLMLDEWEKEVEGFIAKEEDSFQARARIREIGLDAIRLAEAARAVHISEAVREKAQSGKREESKPPQREVEGNRTADVVPKEEVLGPAPEGKQSDIKDGANENVSKAPQRGP